MPENTNANDELETTVRNALDAAEEPNSPHWDLPNVSLTSDDEGNVTVHALEKRRNKRNVHRKQRDALDAAGLEWEFKEDGRFSDGVNPRKVVVTGFADEDDEEETVELDAENPHEKPVSATESSGGTYRVRVEEEFADGSTHTDHYTEGQAWNVLVGLREILNDEEGETVELDPENVHEKPVRVRESPGGTYAVVVEEEFGDGSTHTDHYTETQARKLLSDLQAILSDDEEIRPDGGDEDAPVLLPDGGQVQPDDEADEDPSTVARDEAEVVQVRGEADGISTVSVYYSVGTTLFRARLRPSSALPEDWTTHRGEALTLSDLSEVEKPDGERLPVVDRGETGAERRPERGVVGDEGPFPVVFPA